MLSLDELKKLHDKAYEKDQVTREQASDDLIFAWVTQWDDQLLGDSQLEFRGEFNILRKAMRQILGELASSPVQPDFHPKDETRTDDAELMDMLYRADDRRLDSQEAYDFAKQDAVVCGYGAWEVYTEWATNRIGDENQVIKRRYIPEANNTCFWDPNDNTLAKSKANYVSILTRYSKGGYEDLVRDLTGDEDYVFSQESFKFPEQSYTFPWAGGESEKVYVVTFYHREKIKDTILTLVDPIGETMMIRESELDEQSEEIINEGFDIVSEKEIMRWQVTKYIASGKEILNGDIDPETGERMGEVISGENIPVVPVYGEYVPQLEGETYWSGITRLAKDPQRLRNFQMSYLADIVSRSPRPKPIFFPEQVQGFEAMYEQSGSDNNYPFLYQNRKSAAGEDLPMGPAGMMPEQSMPQALAASIQLTREAVEDVANPGIPQDVADPDMSGKAILALQNRIDQQSYIYQHNFKHAKKRDAEIYASIASEINDTPKTVTIQTPDGNTKQAQLMRAVVDESGEVKILNDLTNMEFDVYADIGPSYESQKQQTLEQIGILAEQVKASDPILHKVLVMKSLEIMPGVAFDDVRDYVRNQLIEMGIKEPETEKEIQEMMAKQMQQGQADPQAQLAMMEGQARLMEGQAAIQNEINDANKVAVDQFNAETNRQKVQIQAAEAGVKIEKTQAETVGQQINNIQTSMGVR